MRNYGKTLCDMLLFIELFPMLSRLLEMGYFKETCFTHSEKGPGESCSQNFKAGFWILPIWKKSSRKLQ